MSKDPKATHYPGDFDRDNARDALRKYRKGTLRPADHSIADEMLEELRRENAEYERALKAIAGEPTDEGAGMVARYVLEKVKRLRALNPTEDR